ncbi:MAG: NAD(P)/FAD-dependent oxidoreductase, partial [Chloroflexota bacterium]
YGDGQIIYYRTFDDYQHLRSLAEQSGRFAVIGGGFIGSELAAALRMTGNEVVMIFPDEGIGANIFPGEISQFLNAYYRNKGVDLRIGQMVTAVDQKGHQLALKTVDNQEIEVDGVVAGIGIQPNVELAQATGLQVDNGVVVDEFLQASLPGIFAAGDVANFYNPAVEKRIRVEHEDNALTMGKQAGKNMALSLMSKELEPYHHLPYFYSDLFELGYEAVGDLDSRLETVVDWQEPFKKGVIYYLRDGRVRGVLLWNVWDQVPAARKLIAEKGPFKPEDLKGRLPA